MACEGSVMAIGGESGIVVSCPITIFYFAHIHTNAFTSLPLSMDYTVRKTRLYCLESQSVQVKENTEYKTA